MTKFAWSHSRLKNFETCPRQYYHMYVVKDTPYVQGPEAKWGDKGHKCIEIYGVDGKPLPTEFAFAQPTVDAVLQARGVKKFEMKMALTEDLEPTTYFGKNVWWRGQADVAIINLDTNVGRVVDWKFGKSKYVDVTQLEQMALGLFAYFPQLEKVKGALSFLTENKFVPAEYHAQDQDKLWDRWRAKVERMGAAYDSGVWNPKPSGLCRKHCPILSCEHNGRGG